METQDEVKYENKMGIMPVNKLLLSMSLPIILSMFILSLYNIVDSIFVAKISEEALTAVSLAFPLQQFMISVAVGTFVGVNALLSKSLGEKDSKTASKIANSGLFLSFVSYFAFLLIGLLFLKTYFSFQTDSQVIVDYGVSYLRIICICSFALFAQNAFEKLLTSTGKTFYTMITQLTGSIINIILNPILIFGLLGFPEMGIRGSAIATVIGQTAAAVLAFIFNMKVNKEIKLNLKSYRPEGRVIKKIYSIGIPSILMVSISSVMTFGLNKILLLFSTTATAVFGIYFKLQNFVFMPVFGLNNGMVPIIAYNYGAGNRERIVKTIKLSIFYAVLIMLVGFTLLQLFPKQLLFLFSASENMLEIGIPSLKIISICLVFAGISIISSSVFQALGNAFLSMLISFIRQIIVLLPAAYFLAQTGNIDNVWWAFPIAEVVAVVLSLLFLKYVYNKVISPVC